MPAGAEMIPAPIPRLTGVPVMIHPARALIFDKKTGPGVAGSDDSLGR